jgi:putative Mg2+ transporter-C (MgtC) family protein
MMTINPLDYEMILRVILALFLGSILGFERERHGISAGIRTYGAISLGACVFGVLSLSIVGADPSRVAAQVATGMGFLCGGVIFREGNHVNGLTTAATLWATAALGLAVAFGMYVISITTTLLIFLLLSVSRLPGWKKFTRKVKSSKDGAY